MLIETSSVCNFNCIFCGSYKRKNTGHMPFDIFKKAIEQVIDFGLNKISLCPLTGEFFCDPNWKEKIEWLETVNLPYYIYTNFSLLNEDDIMFLSRLNKLIQLRISINGHDEDSFLKMTRSTKQSYNNIIKNLKTLYKIEFKKLRFNIKSNLNYFKMINMTNELFYNVFKITIMLKPEQCFQDTNIDNFNGIVDKELTDEFNLTITNNKCKVMEYKNSVLWNGDFNLCGCRDINQLSTVGNIQTEKIKDLVLKKVDKNIVCKNCSGVEF